MDKTLLKNIVDVFKEGDLKQTDFLNLITDEIISMRDKEVSVKAQILLLNRRFDIKLTTPGYRTWTRRKIEKGIFSSKKKKEASND